MKKSLIIDLGKVDKAMAEQYEIKEGSWLLKHDFVLVSESETEQLRDKKAVAAMEQLGLRMKLLDHLPVPELD